jgi:hypothetical protein
MPFLLFMVKGFGEISDEAQISGLKGISLPTLSVFITAWSPPSPPAIQE